MALVPLTSLVPQFFDGNGRPLVGGTLQAFLAGTSDPTTLYDVSGDALGVEVTLDARGEPPTKTLFVESSISYKFRLADKNDAQIWLIDGISFSAGSGDDGQWVSEREAEYISATQFRVDGDLTTGERPWTVRDRVQAEGDATGEIYGTITDISYAVGTNRTTVTAAWDSGALSNESLTVWVGIISAENTSFPPDALPEPEVWVSPLALDAANAASLIQAAIDEAQTKEAALRFWPGTYTISGDTNSQGATLLVSEPLTIRGGVAGGFDSSFGVQIVSNDAAGVDLLKLSDSAYVYGLKLENISLECGASAGHVMTIGTGLVYSRFQDVNLRQDNPAKSLIYQRVVDAANAGVYDCIFEGGKWQHADNGTVAPVDLRFGGTLFNLNTFRNIRVDAANGALHFFDIRNTGTGGNWLEHIEFDRINFERTNGGCIRASSALSWEIRDCAVWDLPAATTNHLFQFEDDGNNEASRVRFTRLVRNGGTLGAGLHDIKTTAGTNFTYDHCMQTGGNLSIDVNGKPFTGIGMVDGDFANLNSTPNYSIVEAPAGTRGLRVPVVNVLSYMDLTELIGSDPSAPGAGKARLYLHETGTGSLELRIAFANGTIKTMATDV